MQTSNKKEISKVLLITAISIFLIAIVVKAATTIGTNISTDGTLGVTGLTTLGAATSTSATSTKYIMVGSAFTLPSTFNYDGDLAVSSDLVVGGTASTTNAVFSGRATTTGNMVIGHNNQATTGATTTVTIGSYNGGAAGNGTCLKLRQGGAWIYCVPSLAGFTCSATSCE